MIDAGLLDSRIGDILSILSSHRGEELTADTEHRIHDGDDMAALLRALQDTGLVSQDFGFQDASDIDGVYGIFTKYFPTAKGALTVNVSELDYDRVFNGRPDEYGNSGARPISEILGSLLAWLDHFEQLATARIATLRDIPPPRPTPQPKAETETETEGLVWKVPLMELVSAARAGVELFGTAGDPHDVLSRPQVDALQRVAEAYADEDGHRPAVTVAVLRHADHHGEDVSVHPDAAAARRALAQTVLSRWDQLRGETGVPAEPDSLSDAEAVQLYFARRGDEFHSVHEDPIDIG